MNSKADSISSLSSQKELSFLISVRYRLANFLLIIGTPMLFLIGVYDLKTGNYQGGILNLFIGSVAVASFIVLNKQKTIRKLLYGSRLILFLLAVHFILHLSLESIATYKLLWIYIFPPFAMFLLGKSEGIVWVAIFYLLAAAIILFPNLPFISNSYSEAFKIRFLTSLVALIGISYMVENIRQETQETMLRYYNLRIESEDRYRVAYETLKETQSQLVQSAKLASIGELASGVAHELNQPLMVVRTNADLLIKNSRKENQIDEDNSDPLKLIKRNTSRMMKIINHLRVFSRQSPTEKASLKINDIVADSSLMISEQLRIQGIEFRKNLSDNLPDIMGNANQLEQVILNFITNARDAIKEKCEKKSDHKGRIEIVTTNFRDHADKIEMLFKDNGVGIPDRNLERIFDPFFTTKKVGMGTGLGLSISYGIVRDHGGEIEVVETGPHGSKIRIVL